MGGRGAAITEMKDVCQLQWLTALRGEEVRMNEWKTELLATRVAGMKAQ